MLEIRLLGAFVLLQEGRELIVSSLRQQSLLAYLLLHLETPQPRQRIAFELWPDVPEPQARNSLRNLLFQIRRLWPAVDTYLHADGSTLRWRAEADFRCDVHQFERLLAAAQQSPDPEQERAALEKAVAAYAGPLLPGCYDEWLLSWRTRLHDAFGRALQSLVELCMQAGELDGALVYGGRWLRHDPLDETAYRRVMALYAEKGEPGQALRIFEECRHMLALEFQAQPDAATVALANRIQARRAESPPEPASMEFTPRARERQSGLSNGTQTEPPATAHPQAPEFHPPVAPRPLGMGLDEPALIGRAEEWAALRQSWEAVHAHTTSVVIIRGEAGIGKTRLAAEFIGHVLREGHAAGQANCFSTGTDSAYEPIVAWLRTPVFARERVRLADVWLAELARLLPEILVERPDLRPADSITESWHRRRMFQALAEGLTVVEGPLLLFIDDLHWVDQETVQWLTYFLRQRPATPVLLLATLREEDALDLPWLQQAFVEWRRLGILRELAPPRLSAAHTHHLAQAVAGAPLEASLATRLYAETLGNPLFVVETARGGQAMLDAMYPAGQSLGTHPEATPLPVPWQVFPPKIQAAIESRLARLSPGARELLQVAAVLGRDFPLSLLATVAGNDQSSTVDAVEELWNRRLIQESMPDGTANPPTGGNAVAQADMDSARYTFSHDRVREFVYRHINAVRRRVLHRRVADVMAARQRPDQEAMSALIATHYEAADSLDQAVRHYMTAALHANIIHAYYKSEQLYGQAMRIAGRLNLPARTLIMIYIERGRMLELVGQYEQAVAIYEEFSQLAQRRGDRNMEAYAVVHLAVCFVEPSTMHDRTRALPLLERGFRLAPHADHPRVQAGMLWCRLMDSAHYGTDLDTERFCREGLTFCAEHKLDYLHIWFVQALAVHWGQTNRHAESKAQAAQAHRAFLDFNDPAKAAAVLNQQAAFAYHQLDFEGACRAAQEAAGLAQRIENPANLASSHLIQGLVALHQGHIEAGVRHCRASIQLSREADMAHTELYARLELGRFCRLLGNFSAAQMHHQAAYALAQKHLGYLLHAAAAQLAADCFAAGQFAEGEIFLDEARSHEPTASIARAWQVLAYLPEAQIAQARHTGNWADATRMTEARLAEAQLRNLPFYLPLLHIAQAECYLGTGQLEATRQRIDMLPPAIEGAPLPIIHLQAARLHAQIGQSVGTADSTDRFADGAARSTEERWAAFAAELQAALAAELEP